MITQVKARMARLRRAMLSLPGDTRLLRQARGARRAGKSRIIVNLSSVPLHFNFVRGLVHRLAEDPAFYVMVACEFDPRTLRLPEGTVLVDDFRLIRVIPSEFLLTVDAGAPLCPPGAKTVHIPHALASTHVIFPEGSFDHFDYIFCAGPHHMHELTEMLPKRGVKHYTLIPSGYEVVDRLMKHPHKAQKPPKIAFAPSWGPYNALARHGKAIVGALIEDYQVVVRPHVMSLKQDAAVIDGIKAAYSDHPHFSLDLEADSLPTLSQADLLISDWGGAAFEYTLAYLKPVVFIDGPMKVFNPNWASYLKAPGIECVYREKVGAILAQIEDLVQTVGELLTDAPLWAPKIERQRKALLYNIGRCAEVSHQALSLLSKGQNCSDWVSV